MRFAINFVKGMLLIPKWMFEDRVDTYSNKNWFLNILTNVNKKILIMPTELCQIQIMKKLHDTEKERYLFLKILPRPETSWFWKSGPKLL